MSTDSAEFNTPDATANLPIASSANLVPELRSSTTAVVQVLITEAPPQQVETSTKTLHHLTAEDDIPTLVDLLKQGFMNPMSVMTLAEYRADRSTSYVIEQIYKERLQAETIAPFDVAAAQILDEWTINRPESADKLKAARTFLVFLAFAKPIGIRSTLNKLIDNEHVKQNQDWFARLLTLLQDYEHADDVTQPKRDIAFWESHIHTFDVSSKYASVVLTGMMNIDVDRAFECLPELIRTEVAAKSATTLFSWYIKRHINRATLEQKITMLQTQLEPAVYAIFQEWLAKHPEKHS